MNLIIVDNQQWNLDTVQPGLDAFFVATEKRALATIIDDCMMYTDIDPEVYFLINIHCTLVEEPALGAQAGVKIYRHLLRARSGQVSDFRVLFFSALTRELLIRLKPENYVLNFYTVLPVPFTWEYMTAILYRIKEWPKLNSSSENLLSGWSLSGAEKLLLGKKKILMVDDQTEEWELVFNELFENNQAAGLPFTFLKYDNSLPPRGRFSLNKLGPLYKHKISEADVIISDFYLEEYHAKEYWMDTKTLQGISGFQLFNAIRGGKINFGINRGVPVILHSSSNKIPYFKFFQASGVDDWVAKDERAEASKAEKSENFQVFKKTVEQFLHGKRANVYLRLKNILARIDHLGQDVTYKWWHAGQHKEETLAILKTAWGILRSLLNREEYFARNVGVVDLNFTPTAVAGNLGKIREIHGIEDNKSMGYLSKYFVQVRNAACHYIDYKLFELDDCLIYFECWLVILESPASKKDIFKKIDPNTVEYMIQDNGDKWNTYQYRLLFVYIQFYNSDYPKSLPGIREKVKQRSFEILRKASKKILVEEILYHKPDSACFGISLKDRVSRNLTNDPAKRFNLIEEDDYIYISNA